MFTVPNKPFASKDDLINELKTKRGMIGDRINRLVNEKADAFIAGNDLQNKYCQGQIAELENQWEYLNEIIYRLSI